jgi:CheY-like chemotaxis protein
MSVRALIINDDPAISEILSEILVGLGIPWPVSYSDLASAIADPGRVDLVLIDISGIAPINLGPAAAYSQIACMVEKHPHAPVVIVSGVSSNFAADVADRVREVQPGSVVEYIDLTMGIESDLIAVLRKLGLC